MSRLASQVKAVGRAAEDAALERAGLDRAALDAQTRERWKNERLGVALAGDLAQFKTEWRAKLPVFVVVAAVIVGVFGYAFFALRNL